MRNIKSILLKDDEQLKFDFVKPIRTITSFDDVVQGQSVIIQAWHGTYADSNTIKSKGFIVPEHERNPLIIKIGRESLMGKGIYFVDSKYQATKWGTPIQVEVALRKPYVINHGYIDLFRALNPRKIMEDGFDGIICQGGKYGLKGLENYRQGVCFYPNQVQVIGNTEHPIKFKLVGNKDELLKGMRVVHKNTGEVGVIASIRYGLHYEYIAVRWNGSRKLNTKARTDNNVLIDDLIVQDQ